MKVRILSLHSASFGAASGVILSAVYALTLYRRVVFGELPKTGTGKVQKYVLRSSLREQP